MASRPGAAHLWIQAFFGGFMTGRSAFCLALVLASCATSRTATVPQPLPEPAPAPAAPAPSAVPQASPVFPEPAPVSDSMIVDSVAQAAHARDSALDQAMLERLATAVPPEAAEAPGAWTADADAAALRGSFDIDVANWLDHGRVKYYLGFFTGMARERMGTWLQRLPRYEPTFRAKLVARGLPGDLAYLPLIESGYSATAVSRSRAVGMWQFMKGTARLYGLQVDSWVDERRDVPKATDAAVRFLADLTARFGSPYLAAAAYNGGPGRIQRGLKRLDPAEEDEEEDTSAEPDDGSPQAGDVAFFQLADSRYIKKETKDYVPKLIAAALIAKQPQRYGFPLLPAEQPAPPDSVTVPDATGLDVIARFANVPLADLEDLNPQFLHPVTPPGRRAVVRVPAGAGPRVQAALDSLPESGRLTSFPHRARKGETLAAIGNRYGVTTVELKKLNPSLRSRAPRPGESVNVPGRARMKAWLAESRRYEASERARVRIHRVRRGETLRSIAVRFGVTQSQLRSWNHLQPGARLWAGQRIRISPARPARRATSGARTASTADSKVHVVKKGETLTSLARKCGSSAQEVRLANNIPPGRTLLAGQRIRIPC